MNKLLRTENKTVAAYPGLSNFLKQLDTINKQLRLSNKEDYIQQKPQMIVHQSKIEEYLKILFHLNIHFDIPKGNNKIYKFTWLSRSKGSFTNQSFYYEIGAMFYNYAAIYLTQGLRLFQTQDPVSIKKSLQFFRSALWGFEEVPKCMVKCRSTGMVPNELLPNEVQMLKALAEGLSYLVFYSLSKDKLDDQKKLSLNQSISQNFSRVLKCISESNLNGKQFRDFNSLKTLVEDHYYYHLSKVLVYEGKKYGSLHDDDMSSENIGKQLAVLKKLSDVHKRTAQAYQSLGVKKEELEGLEVLVEKYPAIEKENKKVFKVREFKLEEVIEVKPFSPALTSNQNPYIKQKDPKFS
jgi:hypothetical protein